MPVRMADDAKMRGLLKPSSILGIVLFIGLLALSIVMNVRCRCSGGVCGTGQRSSSVAGEKKCWTVGYVLVDLYTVSGAQHAMHVILAASIVRGSASNGTREG